MQFPNLAPDDRTAQRFEYMFWNKNKFQGLQSVFNARCAALLYTQEIEINLGTKALHVGAVVGCSTFHAKVHGPSVLFKVIRN